MPSSHGGPACRGRSRPVQGERRNARKNSFNNSPLASARTPRRTSTR